MPVHDPEARSERVATLVRDLEEGRIAWEAFVDAVMLELPSINYFHALDEIPFDLRYGRLVPAVLHRQPDHWFRGLGDNGAAEDMLATAERETYPPADFGQLATILAPLESGRPVSAEERRAILDRARAMAGENPAALGIVEHYEKK